MSSRIEFLKECGQAAKEGALKGMRQAPLMFFAPTIAICRLIKSTTVDLLREQEEKRQARLAQKRARL